MKRFTRRASVVAVFLLFVTTATSAFANESVRAIAQDRLEFALQRGIAPELARDVSELSDSMRLQLSREFDVPFEFFADSNWTPPGEARFLVVGTLAVNAPAITFISPSRGPLAGGTQVTIRGFNFVAGATVTFGGIAATNVTVPFCDEIRATTPARATPGAVDVVVTNPDAQTATATAGFTYADPPTITAIRPPSGPTSGGTRVLITGTNFRTDVTPSVSFGNISASFTTTRVIDANNIVVTTPPGQPGAVDVRLSQSATGSVTLSGGFVYTGTPNAPPVITGFSPSSGPPGTTVTITGTGLFGPNFFSDVSFNRAGSSFGQFASITGTPSATQIMTTVPNRANTGPLTVRTPFGTARTCNSFTVTPAGAPTITNVTPTTLNTSNQAITVTGTNFVDVMLVRIGATNSSFFSVVSPTELRVFAPFGRVSGPITVVSSAGTATSASSVTVSPPAQTFCTTSAAPAITSFTPDPAPRGTTLTIIGTNFRTSTEGGTQVRFTGGAFTQTVTVVSPTQLTVTVPFGAQTGPVEVITDFGSATSTSNLTLTAPPPPAITSFTPASAIAGRTFLSITGTNLGTVTHVTFSGNVAVRASSFSDTNVGLTVPLGAQTGPIMVTTLAGTATSASNLTINCGPPTITSFSPASGNAGSFVTVLIQGTNFADVSFGELEVLFNGVRAPFQSPNSDGTNIQTQMPAGATTGPITVRTAYGSATSASNFTVNAVPPAISSLSPGSGAPGSGVIISGTSLAPVTNVDFCCFVAAQFTIVDNATILATVPANAATGTVRATAPLGSALSTFTVTSAAAAIIGFSNRGGSAGNSVTIAGMNFTGATSVTFNGTAATFTVDSPNVITATVPTGATTGPIAVTTPNGTATSATSFTISPAPAITSVSPSFGPLSGGTTITITGTGFQTGATVSIGGTSATNVTVVSSTQITAVTPPRSFPTTTSVTVTNPDGQSVSASSAFTYGNQPKGDANGDGAISVGDVFYLINNLFASGPAPIGPGDANADGAVTVGDVFYLINFLFAGGPAPL